MPPTTRYIAKPDFSRFETVLRRTGVPDRIPFYELFSNIEAEVLKVIGRETGGAGPGWSALEREDPAVRQHVTYMYLLGYDYVNIAGRGFAFPRREIPKTLTSRGARSFYLAASHTIACREDFDRYPWPEMRDADFSPLERAAGFLPEGMKVVAQFSGVLENVMWLLGYEGISYLLRDDEPLVRDMFDAVGSRIVAYFDQLASFDCVGALAMGDDLGFRTQTLVSPEVLRAYVFPWHRRLVETVHRHGKPILLHACGNLREVMEDIIGCGWDAKHSFEDAIEPVWEARDRYGDRISLLGGFDMDRLCRMSEGQVREHTRFLLARCGQGGGWALGTGNSVADYVPVGNFLAMLQEGFRGRNG